MKDFFVYLFWPNPGNADYDSPKALALLIVCALMIVISIGLSFWRKKQGNPIMKKLSRSWASASFWFGLVGLILVVSRVEQIQFIAARVLWIVWAAALAFYLFVQIRSFRARYYTVLPHEPILDPRSKYLPKKKR